MSGEHSKPDVIKKSITNPETGGTLTVIHKRDVVADTIGHVLALPNTLLLGLPSEIGKNPSPELVDQILEVYKHVPWKGDVLVRLGHTDVKEDWERAKRMITDEGNKRKAIEIMGKPFLELASARARLFRASSYNTFSKTVHLFQNDLAILAHELGHHEDIESRGKRMGGLFAKLRREYRASQLGMRRLPDDETRKNAMKKLEPAFGTYVGQTLGKWYMVGRLLVALGQNTHMPQKIEQMPRNKTVAAFLREMLLYNGIKLAPVLAAHITSRLPWRKSSFGYVFEGKEPKQDLAPHQVLVATAKATV